jgi:hypothetical protein
MELKSRTINGKKSDTHFLYTDKKGREWSVVDFEKFMSKPPMGEFFGTRSHSDLFGYNWEGMQFNEKDNLQVRDMTVEGVIGQIDEL